MSLRYTTAKGGKIKIHTKLALITLNEFCYFFVSGFLRRGIVAERKTKTKNRNFVFFVDSFGTFGCLS